MISTFSLFDYQALPVRAHSDAHFVARLLLLDYYPHIVAILQSAGGGQQWDP